MFAKRESYSLEQLPRTTSLNRRDCNTEHERNDFPNGRSNQRYKAFLSLFYLTLQTVSLQLIIVIIKKLSYISTCQLSLIRFAGAFVISLPMTVFHDKYFLGQRKDLIFLALRGLLVVTALFLHMAANRYLQLVEVSIVMCIYPFFTAIIARILLKEPFGRVQTVTLLITICGVLLTLRLTEMFDGNISTHYDGSFIIGLIMSIGCLVCLSFSTVFGRKLKNIHFSILMLHMGLFGIIENGILNATVFPLVSINCGWDELLCILIGILGVGTDCFLTFALQLEPAGLVSVEKASLEVLVSAVFQILFFWEYPDIYAISGIVLVIASLFVIGIKNWILTMPVSSNTRQKLKWMLT